MAESLKVCLYSKAVTELDVMRPHFETIDEVTMVGQATTWPELRRVVDSHDPDLVAMDLDDAGQPDLSMVTRTLEVVPEGAVLGLSRLVDPKSLIAAIRAGCSQIVAIPIEEEDLRDALNRIRVSRAGPLLRSRRVCVVGASGGVGATTIVCNLAIELARLNNQSAAVVDLNLEYGDAACAFDCEPTYTIADVCTGDVEVDRVVLDRAMHELPCNVSLLATPRSITEALQVNPEGIEAALSVLREMFPFVVVDLPRSYSFLSAATLKGTDRVLIITQLSVPILRNTERVYQYLLEMGVEEDSIEFVVNRSNASFEQLTREDVEAHFQRRVLAMIPNDYRRLKLSLDMGHPLNQQSACGPARSAITTLARTLAQGESPNESSEEIRKGLLSKLWSGFGSPSATDT